MKEKPKKFQSLNRTTNFRTHRRPPMYFALKEAAKIQEELLPEKEFEIGNYQIAATSIPSEIVNGDMYDHFPIPNMGYGVFVGDITGHGPPAAIMVPLAQYVVRKNVNLAANPNEIMPMIEYSWSNEIQKGHHNNTPHSAILARFYPGNNILRTDRAGSPYPLKVDKNGIVMHINNGRGELVNSGLNEDFYSELDLNARKPVFDTSTIALEKDDTLLFYTDGLTDTQNQYGNNYGVERVINTLSGFTKKHNPQSVSAADIRDKLIDDMENYRGNTPRTDDVTVMVIKYR